MIVARIQTILKTVEKILVSEYYYCEMSNTILSVQCLVWFSKSQILFVSIAFLPFFMQKRFLLVLF